MLTTPFYIIVFVFYRPMRVFGFVSLVCLAYSVSLAKSVCFESLARRLCLESPANWAYSVYPRFYLYGFRQSHRPYPLFPSWRG